MTENLIFNYLFPLLSATLLGRNQRFPTTGRVRRRRPHGGDRRGHGRRPPHPLQGGTEPAAHPPAERDSDLCPAAVLQRH